MLLSYPAKHNHRSQNAIGLNVCSSGFNNRQTHLCYNHQFTNLALVCTHAFASIDDVYKSFDWKVHCTLDCSNYILMTVCRSLGELLYNACQHFPISAESRQFLLYARQTEIRGVDIDSPYYNYIISFTVPDIDNVTVLDYDAMEHRIYWSDVRTQSIKRAFINGTGVETVVSAGMEYTLWCYKLARDFIAPRCSTYCNCRICCCPFLSGLSNRGKMPEDIFECFVSLQHQ